MFVDSLSKIDHPSGRLRMRPLVFSKQNSVNLMTNFLNEFIYPAKTISNFVNGVETTAETFSASPKVFQVFLCKKNNCRLAIAMHSVS